MPADEAEYGYALPRFRQEDGQQGSPHHTSHVTRHTSHVTRHTSHVTRHTSHVNKVYHIVTPQAPIISNENYDKFAINDYPNGFNAVVAVLSYTGYDMEDACIINKASVRDPARFPQ